ncbi:MAG: heptosyltransferase-3, partial [Candidatus Omnitrophota bacterium]
MDKNKVKRVLIITLSNIGDAILSFPVIDGVLNGMPDAQVSVMVGPKSRHLFENNKCIDEVIIYNKKLSIFKKITWIFSLRKKRFDFIIDLKNSGMPLLLSPKYCTPLDGNKKESVHMKDKHLNRLKLIYPFEIETSPRHMFETTEEDVSSVDHLLKEASGQRFFVVAPGSLNEYKRWAETNFTKVCNK